MAGRLVKATTAGSIGEPTPGGGYLVTVGVGLAGCTHRHFLVRPLVEGLNPWCPRGAGAECRSLKFARSLATVHFRDAYGWQWDAVPGVKSGEHGCEFGEAFGDEGEPGPGAALVAGDESGVGEHLEVVGHGRLGQG